MRSRILAALATVFLVSQAARADFIMTANLSGKNEASPNASAATGTGTFTFLTGSQTINYDIVFSGLAANVSAAHIHFGPVGVSGPVILPFSALPPATSGEITGTLSAANLINQGSSGINTFADIVNAAQAGNLYANMHDSVFPAGEIRGQLTAVPEPSSMALTAMGLLALGALTRRKAS